MDSLYLPNPDLSPVPLFIFLSLLSFITFSVVFYHYLSICLVLQGLGK